MMGDVTAQGFRGSPLGQAAYPPGLSYQSTEDGKYVHIKFFPSGTSKPLSALSDSPNFLLISFVLLFAPENGPQVGGCWR